MYDTYTYNYIYMYICLHIYVHIHIYIYIYIYMYGRPRALDTHLHGVHEVGGAPRQCVAPLLQGRGLLQPLPPIIIIITVNIIIIIIVIIMIRMIIIIIITSEISAACGGDDLVRTSMYQTVYTSVRNSVRTNHLVRTCRYEIV